MTVFVFAGPSVSSEVRSRYSHMMFLPPVEAGDLLRLPAERGDVVAVIDGYFFKRPAVRHKEILSLIDRGVRVIGAASMGALRAAELHSFGMEGHGQVFQKFVNGSLTGDDEVALLHATAAEDYQPLTEALVNVRHVLSELIDSGDIDAPIAHGIIAELAGIPFTYRTRDAVRHSALACGATRGNLEALEMALRRTTLKEVDAVGLLNRLGTPGQVEKAAKSGHNWTLCETVYLRQWQDDVIGKVDPNAGNVSDSQVLQFCRIFSYDYPQFHTMVSLRALARRSRDGLLAELCFNASEDQTGSALVSSLIAAPPTVSIGYLRELGILAPGTDHSAGLDGWLTATERSLPGEVRSVISAARCLFQGPALLWDNPFLDTLRQTEAFHKARTGVTEMRRFTRSLQAVRPDINLQRLSRVRIVEWFARRWGVDGDFDEELLRRGYAHRELFFMDAAELYAYDKAFSVPRDFGVADRRDG